jgi:indolepyruvate ferredoxin oxidoreductase beta subunit
VYATVEKMAMGDGRFDAAGALAALGRCAGRVVSFDMEAERASAGTVVSAVMFGALVGAGVLPIGREIAERVVAAGGRGVEPSLRGFAAGVARAAGSGASGSGSGVNGSAADAPAAGAAPVPPAPPPTESEPDAAETQAIIAAGVARCRDYLDAEYGALYLERLAPIRAIDANGGAHGELTRETARFLALWMCYEDIPRVAELKSRPERLERIRRETGARPGEPVRIVEYFKPGFDEVADMIPPALADRLRRWARRRGARAVSERGLRIDTTSLAGYAALRGLASMRRLRRRSSRYAGEQQAIERWLGAIRTAGDPQLALEIALTARLIKGYSDTQQRGRASFARIMDTLVLPVGLAMPERTAAIRAARLAALCAPEDAALDRELARHGIAPRPPKAVPVRFVPRRKSA